MDEVGDRNKGKDKDESKDEYDMGIIRNTRMR